MDCGPFHVGPWKISFRGYKRDKWPPGTANIRFRTLPAPAMRNVPWVRPMGIICHF
jgi:hypothetical protein